MEVRTARRSVGAISELARLQSCLSAVGRRASPSVPAACHGGARTEGQEIVWCEILGTQGNSALAYLEFEPQRGLLAAFLP